MKVNVNFSLSPPVFRIKNRMTTGQVSLNKQHTTFYIRTFLDTSDKHSCLEYNMQPSLSGLLVLFLHPSLTFLGIAHLTLTPPLLKLCIFVLFLCFAAALFHMY